MSALTEGEVKTRMKSTQQPLEFFGVTTPVNRGVVVSAFTQITAGAITLKWSQVTALQT